MSAKRVGIAAAAVCLLVAVVIGFSLTGSDSGFRNKVSKGLIPDCLCSTPKKPAQLSSKPTEPGHLVEVEKFGQIYLLDKARPDIRRFEWNPPAFHPRPGFMASNRLTGRYRVDKLDSEDRSDRAVSLCIQCLDYPNEVWVKHMDKVREDGVLDRVAMLHKDIEYLPIDLTTPDLMYFITLSKDMDEARAHRFHQRFNERQAGDANIRQLADGRYLVYGKHQAWLGK